MVADDRRRLLLHGALSRVAYVLIEHLPRAGWSDRSRADVQHATALLRSELRDENGDLRSDLREAIAAQPRAMMLA